MSNLNLNSNLLCNIDCELSFTEWNNIISPQKNCENDTNSYGSFSEDTNEYFDFTCNILKPRIVEHSFEYLPFLVNNKKIVDTTYIYREVETSVMNTDHHYFYNEDLIFCDLELQSFETQINDFADLFKSYSLHAEIGISALKGLLCEENFNFWMKLFEDLGVTFYQIYNSKTVIDISVAWITFLKLRKNGPLISDQHIKYLQDMLSEMFNEMVPQSMEQELNKARNFLNKYEELKHAPIFKKMYKILMYVLSFSLFEKMGITFDLLRYNKLEQEALKKEYYSRTDFALVLFDTILFICERGCQCMQTGTLDPIYHTGSKYEDWYRTVSRLKRESQFLSNPEPHHINRFKFLAELDDTIDKGNAIYKHASRIGELEKSTVRYMLQDLELIRSSELSKKAACKERKAPFSILLYGGSSVAKSTLTRMLFYHYGKLFNLPIESEYKYTRIFNDEYWSGFRTNMWCGQVDDIAPLNPNAAQGVDETLLEVIRIQNSVPYVPPQAELCDKGRTPVNFRLFIATTNTEHLNAHAYFACPLAIQRRFPFVIEVKPKPEYIKDSCMLDGSKVPPINEGEYPDYWIFKIKRVVPVSSSVVSQRAKLEVVAEFDDVYDFIQWYSLEAIKYEQLQEKAMNCDDNMSKVNLCENCHLPQLKCKCQLQSDEIFMYADRYNQTYMDFLRENTYCVTLYGCLLSMVWWAVFHLPLFNLIIYYTIGYRQLFVMFGKYLFDDRVMYFFYKKLGNKVQSKIGKYKPVINLVCLGAFGMLLYKVCAKAISYSLKGDSQMFYDIKSSDLIPKKSVACGTDDLLEVNSDEKISESIGKAPEPREEEKENVWYNNDFQLTNFDVSPMNTSYMSFTRDQISEVILKNCVYLNFIYKRVDGDSIKTFKRMNKSVCIGGHIYMFNNHVVPDVDTFDLTIVNDCPKEGVNPNITILVDTREIIRYPEQDLAFLVIKAVPPRKNIINLFCKETLRGTFKGLYLGRNDNGSVFKREVHNIRFLKDHSNQHLNSLIDSWGGFVKIPTHVGDCGSVLLCESGFGPILMGIHYLGSPSGEVVSMMITQDFLQQVVNKINMPVIQCCNPELSTTKFVRCLGALNKKSTVRYLEEGTANVYGSFEGFRQKPKSKVGPTLIRESMVNRGYPINYVAPEMKGWEPWHLALKDMVKPSTKFNNHILKECTQSFIDDILGALTEEDLKEVFVYDDFTAINGAAGVAYVDKMNRNSSAGNPWKKSKKHFIRSIPPKNGLNDPVEADEEIMERVNDCMKKYSLGYRYMPNYSASTKDEPVTKKKKLLKKTRIFTASPFDWGIVVRKYLLSVIRLIQKNKFIFECAPGTIAQSTEWGYIRKYLTTFGNHRIIAGDHGKFDKKMPPAVILAAFEILFAICKAAGYTAQELVAVMCIGEDTAFPLVDFDGDLLELYGSNPSGHPLTVIVNSLANSLYMRYCFYVLSPWGHCRNFKEYVKLMTYGDDLVEGVSEEIDWFTHTTIQKVLADLNLEFTMADKEAASVPFIHIDDASFLKRTWRYDEDVGAYLCPLQHDSLEKMLTTCVKSKTITPEAQSIAIISTAVREYFFYGKKTFEKRSKMLKEVVKENDLELYLQESTFPSWESLKDLFWESSRSVKKFIPTCVPNHVRT